MSWNNLQYNEIRWLVSLFQTLTLSEINMIYEFISSSLEEIVSYYLCHIVDDILISNNNKLEIEKVKAELNEKFNIKDV